MARQSTEARDKKLYSGPVRVTGPGGVVDAQAVVRIAWIPDPVIECSITGGAPLVEVSLDMEARDPKSLQMDMGRQRIVTVAPHLWQFPDGGASATTGAIVEGRIVASDLGPGDQLASVTVDLVNLDCVSESAVLEAGGWRLSLDRQHNTFWGHPPGYARTHIGVLTRIDQGAFTADEASNVLEPVTYFAAFASGGWPGLLRPIGRSAAGRIRWQRWNATGGDEASRHRPWLPYSGSARAFTSGWPGFWQRWHVAESQAAIRALVPVYVEAAHIETPEAKLVLDQVGLELLSWIVVVEEMDMLSGEGHDKLTAADRLRLLLAQARIERGIPPNLGRLADAAPKGTKWVDGVQAVTEMRNAAAHPRKRRSLSPSAEAVEQAGLLAHSYFQQGLLSYFGFRGEFRDRATRKIGRRK